MTTPSHELSKEARSRFFPNVMADWPVMAPPGPAFPTPAELHYLRKKVHSWPPTWWSTGCCHLLVAHLGPVQTDKLIEIIQDDWPANLETQKYAP